MAASFYPKGKALQEASRQLYNVLAASGISAKLIHDVGVELERLATTWVGDDGNGGDSGGDGGGNGDDGDDGGPTQEAGGGGNGSATICWDYHH